MILLDGGELPADHRALRSGYRNAVLLDLTGAAVGPDAPVATLRLRAVREGADATLAAVTSDRAGAEDVNPLGRAATLSTAESSATARVLAPLRVSGAGDPAAAAPATSPSPACSASATRAVWSRRRTGSPGRTGNGSGADRRHRGGGVVELDLKESAQGGTGPHGMLIGATGSGKSELLRTLVLGLAVTHSSEILNFVLVDFKGGATFLGLDRLPHTSAVITNLADELPLVDRMQDALHGEMVRRQELLRAAGTTPRCATTRRRGPPGCRWRRCPRCSWWSTSSASCSSARPEFMELFVTIGRLGRASACTCCWRRRGLTRAASTRAGGPPVLPVGCGRSRRWPSRGPCSASATPTTSPRLRDMVSCVAARTL